MKLGIEIPCFSKALPITFLYGLLSFISGCSERNPKTTKHLGTSVFKDSVAYNEFQGKFISQKLINNSFYEINAKVNDTAKIITFYSSIPVDEKSLHQNDSSTLILKYLIDVDSNTNKPIFRVKVIDIFSVIRKEN